MKTNRKMKKKVKKLLICNSNMFIPTVMTEVLSHLQEHYLVISDTKSITKFFEFVSLPNIDYIEYGQLDNRFDFIKKKKKLMSQVQQYEIGEVVFFHAEFGAMANWLIKKLSHSLPIKYCKIYDSIPAPRSKKWKIVFLTKIRERLMWGVAVEVLEGSAYPLPSLPPSFFKKVKAATIQLPIDNKLVTDYVSEKLGSMNLNAENVLLTGTIVADGLADASFYTKLTNKVIDTVGAENLVSKCHPRFKDLYGKEQDLPQVPSFIPGNVLMDSYNVFIGYESTLLVEAAVAGKKSISLMHFLQVKDEVKQRLFDFFDSRLQGRGKIFFPNTLEELETLVKSKK